MGTNYYMQFKSKTCDCCGRTDEQIHIGKSSYGWTFSFKGYNKDYDVPKIVSIDDWKRELKNPDAYIINEYDERIDDDEFWQIVYSKEDSDRNHTMLYPEGNWLDEYGNSFTSNEFS